MIRVCIVMEKNFIDKRFLIYKKNKIAIYGLGDNALLLLQCMKDYNIVCHIAAGHIGEKKNGLRICSIEDAIKEVEIIIIAASFSATSIIFSRIKDIVPKNIPILNMFGENLSTSDICDKNSYWDEDYCNLLSHIGNHDVISFDIFDTLLMRDVLEPKDIFRILSDKSGNGEFYSARNDAEKKCRRSKKEPTLDDIYAEMEHASDNNFAYSKETMQLEIATEIGHLLPRRKMIDALNYAISKGKRVFLTSDMYLNHEVIASLLTKCDIHGDYELIVSCEYGCSKLSGELFSVLKDKAGVKSILHIGDDELVDKNRAEEKGIDSYLIHSSYRMLAMSRVSYLFDAVKSFSDKKYLGYYISETLNDPFAMHGLHGKISIASEKDVALVLFPITKLFFDFIISNSNDYDCLLFPSRDGYFLYSVYCKYKIEHPELNLPDAKYIYSSRMSLSRASLKNEDNLDALIHKLFGNMSKNCRQYIMDLFGYELPQEFDHSCGELIEKYGKDGLINRIHKYVPQMVGFLTNNSLSYVGYLDSLSIYEYERIAFIDIVSYGTQPYCLSELLGKSVDMLSIGTTGIPNVYLGSDRVRSIYGNVNEEINGTLISQSDLSVLHLLLEMLYSSKDGQFLEISDTGKPTFMKGSEYNIALLDGVQMELHSLFEHYDRCEDVSTDFSPDFCHGMLRIFRKKYSVISDELKQKFVFSDPYDGGFVTVNLTDSL